jgi:UDP-3-O-[3-hydroxymyristoyl] glucosamine N-acyltransferase
LVEFSFFALEASWSVAEIAALTGAEPCAGADLSRRLTGIAPVDLASADDLTFVSETKFAAALKSTKAGAVLTSERFARHAPDKHHDLARRKPYDAFVAVARNLQRRAAPGFAVRHRRRLARRHGASLGAVGGGRHGGSLRGDRTIGDHRIRHLDRRPCRDRPGVRIGSDCAIGANCTITHAHVGDRVIIHAGCDIGQDGFGYVLGAAGHVKIPQVGRVVIDNEVEIGSGTRIDRGGIRDTVIGEGTKIDNLCQIGHNCVVGRHCIIVAQSGLSGSVTLEDFVVLGPRTGIIPHITVGKGAITASRSTVYENIPAGAFWGGFPAKPKRQWLREVVALQRLAERDHKNSEDPPSET